MEFLALDLRIQMAILLLILFSLVWLMAGKVIVRIASLLPWGLGRAFRLLYMLAEGLICLLHKKIGEVFYGLDNGMAALGKRTDACLRQWHGKWRDAEKKYCSVGIMAYGILLWLVCASYKTDGMITSMYSETRDKLIYQLEERQKAREAAAEQALAADQPEVPEIEKESRDVAMIVSTANDPLSIRDIPSMQDCDILGLADRGTTVLWIGDLAFGAGEGDRIEPWVKVRADNGIVGWVRLRYLCPEDERDYDLGLWIE